MNLKEKACIPTAVLMFPIGVYKNMALHGKKTILEGRNAGKDVLDKGYFDSIKQAHQYNSFDPLLERLSNNPEALKEKIAVSRTLKESEEIIDALAYKQIVTQLNNVLQVETVPGIFLAKSIKGKHTAKFDITMPKNFDKLPLEMQQQKLEQLYPKTAEVVSEKIASILETEKERIRNGNADESVVMIRAAQHLNNEKKQDTISVFTPSKNKDFIDNLICQGKPLSVMEITALANFFNVKHNLFLQDVFLTSGIKNTTENIIYKKLLVALEKEKLKPLQKLFRLSNEFNFSLKNNKDKSYNINWVLNMSCSEQYLKHLELEANGRLKTNYPEFYINNKPLISNRINKVPETDVSYLDIGLILDYFSQNTFYL